jgi:hypothetical protein
VRSRTEAATDTGSLGKGHSFVNRREGTAFYSARYLRTRALRPENHPSIERPLSAPEQRSFRMFEIQRPDPKAPSCPVCTGEMALKKIHRQQPQDHFVFKCRLCELEYPIVGQKHD